MGMYTWFSDQDFERCSSVLDTGVNEALQEVRLLMPEWYIEERTYHTPKTWWQKERTEYAYTLFHRTSFDSSEVRYQISVTNRGELLNMLYGLLMGYYKAKEL